LQPVLDTRSHGIFLE